MTKKFICISGIAGAGKDTMATYLKRLLEEDLDTARILSLAYPIKKSLEPVLAEMGLDVFTSDRMEKEVIRGLIIELGRIGRISSKGSHWVQLLIDEANKSEEEYIIVPDVRFRDEKFKGTDEFYKLDEQKAFFCHVQRLNTDGQLMEPYIEDEIKFDPIVRDNCHVGITWESTDDPNYLRGKAKMVYSRYKEFLAWRV